MDTITRDDANELASLLNGTVREDYSGRGMYGAECFGIVCDETDVMIGISIAQAFADYDVYSIGCAARTDSMGHDTIVYFPGWTLEDDDQ